MFLWNTEKCLKIFDKTYVSSDSKEILALAKKAGAIPIKRPKRLLEVPNIPVYQHALKFMDNTDAIVAVQACSPTIKITLLEMAIEMMMLGYKEIMTFYPIKRDKDYHKQTCRIYGSVWGLSRDRLENYGNPYKPYPEVILVDGSRDIHYKEDFEKAKKCLIHQ